MLDVELKRRMKKIMEISKTRVDENQVEYDCPKCRDLGYVFETIDGCDTAVKCECLDKRQSLENLQKCGLTDAFKKKTFQTYIPKTKDQLKAKTMAMKFCNEFKDTHSSLLLCGKPGTGKTHLGISAMLNLINKNIGCKYVEYINMITSLKQSILDEENYIKEMNKYLTPRVLFIDDFLKGKTTDADLKYIYEIINKRYLKGMPVIISSEKSITDIIDWDEAVGSRLVDMARISDKEANIIEFDSNCSNYRLRNII